MKKSTIIIIAIVLLLGILFFVTTCYRGGIKKANLPPGVHEITVKEVVQTSNYTYLNVDEDGKTYWMAVNSLESKPGEVFYYDKFMEMKNFKSKELNREFPTILFVEKLGKTATFAEDDKPKLTTKGKPEIQKVANMVSFQKPAGAISIEELYKNIGKYGDQTVTIRGMVVKFSPEIMNKNWVHLQDGSQFADKFDLTVTTKDTMSTGALVTFTGKISMNKDFGHGYFYDVIMEDAKSSDIK